MNLSPTIIYDLATGEIKSTGSIQVDAEFLEQQMAAALTPWGADAHGIFVPNAPADPARHYVVMLGEDLIVADRPAIPYEVDKTTLTAGDGDYITITGLHNPCELVIDDPDPTVETWRVTVEGGGFEFEAAHPGVYTIQISRFPFLPATIEFTAA